jgi:hypothetical protein
VVIFALLLFLLPLCGFAKSPPIDYREPPPDPPGAGAIANAPPIQDRLVRPGAFQQLPAIDESGWVALPAVKTPYWSFGKVDPVLSEACRLGDFATLPLNRIMLQFVGSEGRARFQVVPPLYRHLLVDRRSLARPGVTYYFLGTAQPDCEVRVDANVKPMSFPAGRGTALPPADPKAVPKRLAQIKSWPK